jgi:hypothetical protein
MRLISFLVALALLSSASLAQQTPATPPQSQPYSTAPLPEVFPSRGRSIEGPNNTTIIVKAVPCTVASRWTDGTITCIGLPDKPGKNRRP